MATTVPVEQVRAEQSREALMVLAYGEVTTFEEARRMLHITLRQLKKLIEDGVMSDACEGKRVDVRSIARYIECPKNKTKRWQV